MMNTLRRNLALTSFLMIAASGLSEAAAVRSGTTLTAVIASTRGSAVAYDSINHVYLVVSALGVVRGRFIAANGTPIGGQFQIQANAAIFAAFPRVSFSADANGGAGGFLVTWSQSDLPGNASMHGRMVAYGQSGPYGVDRQLSVDGNWWEEGPFIAYSTTSHEFFVVYRTFPTYVVRGVRVDTNGAAKDIPFTISQTGQYEDNASVAYNPTTNEYLVCWKGYNDPARFGFVDCRFTQAGANQVIRGPIRLQTTAATYITDTTYNPSTNQFLVTWDAGAGTGIQGRIVNADGTVPGGVIPISRLWHAYDALGVAYNRLARTFFMISHDARACTRCEDGGVEIADSGVPIDNGFLVTGTGAKGSFYPTITASGDDPNWLVTTAPDFINTSVQLVAGTTSNGGAAPPPTSPPPPLSPVPNPMFNIDSPANNAVVLSNGFLVSGWAVDTGATSGTGIDVVAVWAYPKSGAPAILAGTASYGSARPDVGAWLGPRFTPTGWGVLSVLPPGAYSLAVYAHSTVNDSWGTPKLLNVTVQAPPSDPRMWVDAPVQNQNVSGNITVAGWALDRASSTGPGVDAVHVWAYPDGGGAPVQFGSIAANYGNARPDVASVFGSSRFTNSGFFLSATLPPGGGYTLVFYAHSAVTNTFNNAMAVHVTVR